MQGNSLIKTFALLFGIVSIFQLSFTFISSGLERKAENAAISKISDNEVGYLVKNLKNSFKATRPTRQNTRNGKIKLVERKI